MERRKWRSFLARGATLAGRAAHLKSFNPNQPTAEGAPSISQLHREIGGKAPTSALAPGMGFTPCD